MSRRKASARALAEMVRLKLPPFDDAPELPKLPTPLLDAPRVEASIWRQEYAGAFVEWMSRGNVTWDPRLDSWSSVSNQHQPELMAPTIPSFREAIAELTSLRTSVFVSSHDVRYLVRTWMTLLWGRSIPCKPFTYERQSMLEPGTMLVQLDEPVTEEQRTALIREVSTHLPTHIGLNVTMSWCVVHTECTGDGPEAEEMSRLCWLSQHEIGDWRCECPVPYEWRSAASKRCMRCDVRRDHRV